MRPDSVTDRRVGGRVSGKRELFVNVAPQWSHAIAVFRRLLPQKWHGRLLVPFVEPDGP